MAFNVLIVDDSSSMRTILKKIIRASGFNVGECHEAADGKAALSVLADKWVDLVLTDINMPRMNGLELVAEMKRDELMRPVPVVMVTTEGSEKIMQEAMSLGAAGYIRKPFTPADIRRILNSIMGEPDGQRDDVEELEGGDF